MYNPAIHTATNKPIGLIGKPVDARSYYYDAVNFVYRAYVDTAEVLAYLNTASDRTGQFPIIINTGGSLSAGVITGGTNTEWWFKDGVSDGDLVLKNAGGGGSGLAQDFPLIAGTTENPVIIDLSSYPLFTKDATFQYKVGTNPDYTRFDDHQVTETSTGFSIFCHDDGSGKVAESGKLVMKQ